jgi:hypothetical protein
MIDGTPTTNPKQAIVLLRTISCLKGKQCTVLPGMSDTEIP